MIIVETVNKQKTILEGSVFSQYCLEFGVIGGNKLVWDLLLNSPPYYPHVEWTSLAAWPSADLDYIGRPGSPVKQWDTGHREQGLAAGPESFLHAIHTMLRRQHRLWPIHHTLHQGGIFLCYFSC